jgi:DNA-binding LacI/PurR family transcriptional regulator
MKSKRITIRDVARLAGVSRQTVSRVINNTDNVTESTRNKVLKIIERENYRPDPLARGLTTRKTEVLGVVARSFSHATSQILEGAVDGARDYGFQLLICEYEYSDHGEPLYSKIFSRQQIDGLFIIYQGSLKDNFEFLNSFDEELPIVTIGYELKGSNVTRVLFENRKAALLAVEYLIELGHDRIAHITGAQHYFNSEQRFLGYKDALRKHGIPYHRKLVARAEWTVTSGYSAMCDLLSREEEFTAVFCQNDLMAIGCLRAIKEKGLSVPDDVSLIGFDDIPSSRFLDPPLTTVHYPGSRIGNLCAKLLIERIKGDDRPIETLFPKELENIKPELIMRDSCTKR